MRNYMAHARIYQGHFREIYTCSQYINYFPRESSLVHCLFSSIKMGTNYTQGREFVPFYPIINLCLSLPQTQWHALVNIDHMAKQTREGSNVCVCVPMVVICKSCPLSPETASGSMIKVADGVLLQLTGNTDHSDPMWCLLKNRARGKQGGMISDLPVFCECMDIYFIHLTVICTSSAASTPHILLLVLLSLRTGHTERFWFFLNHCGVLWALMKS